MRRFIFASALSLQLLAFGQANGQSLTIPPNSPIRCDPIPCMAPGHQRPKPLYAVDARCVFYVDRNLAGRRFYAGAVVRLSETEEHALLENVPAIGSGL